MMDYLSIVVWYCIQEIVTVPQYTSNTIVLQPLQKYYSYHSV